jgi:hypothetical protein
MQIPHLRPNVIVFPQHNEVGLVGEQAQKQKVSVLF